jgi:hypothetical protein
MVYRCFSIKSADSIITGAVYEEEILSYNNRHSFRSFCRRGCGFYRVAACKGADLYLDELCLRDLIAVKADIDAQMASGLNGVPVEEVTNMQTDAEYDYYATLYKHVKNYGQDKLVVMNPGHYKVIVSLE